MSLRPEPRSTTAVLSPSPWTRHVTKQTLSCLCCGSGLPWLWLRAAPRCVMSARYQPLLIAPHDGFCSGTLVSCFCPHCLPLCAGCAVIYHGPLEGLDLLSSPDTLSALENLLLTDRLLRQSLSRWPCWCLVCPPASAV